MTTKHFYSLLALCFTIWGTSPCGQSEPSANLAVTEDLTEYNSSDTLLPEDSPYESYETGSTMSFDMPFDVPELPDGEIVSIVCDDPETENNWTVKYEDLISSSLFDYKDLLEEEGYTTEDMFTDDDGKHLSAKYNDISLEVVYLDSEATITIERSVE